MVNIIMTKQLEDLFNLPTADDAVEETTEPEIKSKSDIPELADNLSELDKINLALPAVRGLESSDLEMDELAKKATDSFDELMDLGMNIDSRWASDVFNVASSMLGHAITAKNAKLQKKLKMIELQLKKARLDQTAKTPGDDDDDTQVGQGQVLDRNDLLQRYLESRNDEKK